MPKAGKTNIGSLTKFFKSWDDVNKVLVLISFVGEMGFDVDNELLPSLDAFQEGYNALIEGLLPYVEDMLEAGTAIPIQQGGGFIVPATVYLTDIQPNGFTPTILEDIQNSFFPTAVEWRYSAKFPFRGDGEFDGYGEASDGSVTDNEGNEHQYKERACAVPDETYMGKAWVEICHYEHGEFRIDPRYVDLITPRPPSDHEWDEIDIAPLYNHFSFISYPYLAAGADEWQAFSAMRWIEQYVNADGFMVSREHNYANFRSRVEYWLGDKGVDIVYASNAPLPSPYDHDSLCIQSWFSLGVWRVYRSCWRVDPGAEEKNRPSLIRYTPKIRTKIDGLFPHAVGLGLLANANIWNKGGHA